MDSTVLGEIKSPWEVERKQYLCSTLRSSPVQNLSFKVRIRGLSPIIREEKMEDGSIRTVERHRYRAIDFPARTIRYSSEADLEGFPVVGTVNELSKEEIEDLKIEVGRRVVRWRGIEHRQGMGVGPSGQYTDGRIIETHSFEGVPNPRYIPAKNDKPLQSYIGIRLVGSEELRARTMKPRSEKSGFNVLDDIPAEETAPISADELKAQVEALQKQLKAAEERELAQAIASEEADLATPEGRKTQKKQARRKERS